MRAKQREKRREIRKTLVSKWNDNAKRLAEHRLDAERKEAMHSRTPRHSFMPPITETKIDWTKI